MWRFWNHLFCIFCLVLVYSLPSNMNRGHYLAPASFVQSTHAEWLHFQKHVPSSNFKEVDRAFKNIETLFSKGTEKQKEIMIDKLIRQSYFPSSVFQPKCFFYLGLFGSQIQNLELQKEIFLTLKQHIKPTHAQNRYTRIFDFSALAISSLAQLLKTSPALISLLFFENHLEWPLPKNQTTEKHCLLDRLFFHFSTVGGKLLIKTPLKVQEPEDYSIEFIAFGKKAEPSEEENVLSYIAKQLLLHFDASSWTLNNRLSEILLQPAFHTYLLLDTLQIILQAAKQSIRTLFDTLEKGAFKASIVQPTLIVDGYFWDSEEELIPEAKTLAALLLASTQHVYLFNRTALKAETDTDGLLISGKLGEILIVDDRFKEGAEDTHRADLWETALLFPEDLDFSDDTFYDLEFNRIFRQYHLAGNAVLALKKKQAGRKLSLLEEELAAIGDEFIQRGADLLKQAHLYKLIEISWKKENWPETSLLLNQLQLTKMQRGAHSSNVPLLQYQSFELKNRFGIEGEVSMHQLFLHNAALFLLRETELKILDVVLKKYAEELKSSDLLPDEQYAQLLKAFEAVRYEKISKYDPTVIQHLIYHFLDLENEVVYLDSEETFLDSDEVFEIAL